MIIILKKKQFEENKIGLAMKNLLREIHCRLLGIFAAKPSSEIWHNKAKKYLSTQKREKCKSQDGARGKIVDLVAAMPSPEIWQKRAKWI